MTDISPLAASSADHHIWGAPAYDGRLVEIRKLLTQARSVFSLAHPFSDGDALGSQLALHHFCRAAGKRSIPLNFDPLPDQLNWMTGVGDLAADLPPGETFDLAFLMETTEASRMGDRTRFFTRATHCIHLDHHIGVAGLGMVNLIDESASSTCEILYNILAGMGTPLPLTVLESLYVGIMTDTGNFRYSNATPRAHEIAAEMIRAGLAIPDLFRRVYESASLARVAIHGLAMSRTEADCHGRLVWSWLSQDDFVRRQATEVDADGCIRHLCTISGAEIALLFKTTGDGRIKISFRSLGRFDVLELSRRFGGGGHRLAAGAQVTGELADIRDQVISATKAVLQAPPSLAVPQE
jgi:bifunctional oligoribonuclease and PAP phosphatase NrnA